MTRNDVVIGFGQPPHRIEAFQHVTGAFQDRKQPALLEIGIEVRRVGAEHDPATAGENAYDLQTFRMSAYPVHG